ncbi:alpha/beta fold hydrolase [Candidatus Micrarchaeota archaeon]|nr:alpha/beta fold hydrolase [Candidatus Micrarchaeota archaeon]
MEEKLTFKNQNNENISAILSTPENAKQNSNQNANGIVLLHCFTCTKHHRIMRTLADGLSAAGFMVLRIDFSGNGESEGKLEEATYTKMITEVKGAVSMLKGKGAKKIAIAGHSMGAMMSVLGASKDERISAVAFIAGSSETSRIRQIFPSDIIEKVEVDGSAETVVYGRSIILRNEFLRDVEKYDVGAAAKQLNGRPLLIVHGSDDETINVTHAKKLFELAKEPKNSQVKLEIIDGADHLFRKPEHLAKLREVVVGWIKENYLQNQNY